MNVKMISNHIQSIAHPLDDQPLDEIVQELYADFHPCLYQLFHDHYASETEADLSAAVMTLPDSSVPEPNILSLACK